VPVTPPVQEHVAESKVHDTRHKEVSSANISPWTDSSTRITSILVFHSRPLKLPASEELRVAIVVELNVPDTMAVESDRDGLFLLFFRSAYLSIAFGFTAFTFLGFARLGTAIGLIATVIVALGSEIAFIHDRREEQGGLKDIRHVV
jgi:hypothetical protein